ncbi:hypothetical protein GMST_31590 [Geomonas silvestris]|uniref:Phage infection protein n=1 Tax=Geomonas silvestris TaxID=2740184 RepID=A0A6V8MLN2_9BACT|nr:hypothetical protein [Geomonas silvestris]GFO60834.1 hypothetical protein GMST_31590 [Geomonas silvestris]
MNKLKLKLENCYGIKTLTHEFDFSNTKGYSIYAPNGFMKTSFSKAFIDLSKGKDSSDIIFPERKTIRLIQDENDADIQAENVFVIEPYSQEFSSDKTSLLLVNQTIKKKYDDELKKIDDKKQAFLKTLKQLSGLTGRTVTPETEILKCLGGATLFEALEKVVLEVEAFSKHQFSKVVYSEVFNEKTIPFLESGQIRTQLKEYIEKYNELVENSPVLCKSFNHYHAKNVHKNLTENGFFSANHSINLFDGTKKNEIISAEQLDEKLETEKKKILSDETLVKKFDAIDKKLTTVDLRKFRDYLFDNRDILPELENLKQFQKELWLAYFWTQKAEFNEVLHAYQSGKIIIEEAIEAAKSERTDWEEVVEIFNKRFSVPFTMRVTNQEDVILKGSSPQVSFTFTDPEKSAAVDIHALLKVLSQGEKKALYIINILFELNARVKQSIDTILIIDDIADSFDYKNKYAIVEYLREVSKYSNFFPIFLTHNFDFHRTVSGRLHLDREYRLFAVKNGRDLNLAQEKYQKNPFEHWKKNLKHEKFVVASIPFVRNLAEYCGMDAEFLKLTSLLHLKADTGTIKIKDLESIFMLILKDVKGIPLCDADKVVVDLIHETAEAILGEENSKAELESKVILSIAIRLLAEEFMVKEINDQPFVDGITKDQTRMLLDRYSKDFPAKADALKLLNQVNLMTPENIHLNSFMYEPILDMAPEHLKALYCDVKQLSA